MDPRTEVRARPAYLTLVVICTAVGAAILLISGLAFILAPEADAVVDQSAEALLPILLGLGAACVAGASVTRRVFLARALAAASIEEALARIRLGTIFACALSEVPAVLGLAYLVLGGDIVWAPVFFGGALVSWGLAFPRPAKWEEWLSAIEQASVRRPYEGVERRGTTQDE